MVHCGSTFDPGASGLLYYCTSICVRVGCTRYANCVDSQQDSKSKNKIKSKYKYFHFNKHSCVQGPLQECRSIQSGASGLPYCAPLVCISVVIELLAVWWHNKPKTKEMAAASWYVGWAPVSPYLAATNQKIAHSEVAVCREAPLRALPFLTCKT